jgi:GNAT superfamily N-acetyltransferase
MDRLRYIKFLENTIPLFKSFRCGDLQHEEELSAWISNEQEDRDVMQAIKYEQTNVWYYENFEGAIVGYASLAIAEWDLLVPGQEPILIKAKVNVLPALAISNDFQGQPSQYDKKNRYWAQILRDIIRKAKRKRSVAPILGLFVHPDNMAARKIYQKFGFIENPQTEYSRYSGMHYKGMVLDLRKETEYNSKNDRLWIPTKKPTVGGNEGIGP